MCIVLVCSLSEAQVVTTGKYYPDWAGVMLIYSFSDGHRAVSLLKILFTDTEGCFKTLTVALKRSS